MGGGGPRPIIRLCAINFDKNEGPFLSIKWGIMKFSNEEGDKNTKKKSERDEIWSNINNLFR